MDERLNSVAINMRGLGLGALAHANWHASHMSFENRYWPELSVLQAAHAAELLIKARICEEHPLLIFETLPKMTQDQEKLSLDAVSERGRTINFLDLPDRLWATTGIRLENIKTYNSFGKLRNKIAHFTASSDSDLNKSASEFIFQVIDPFIFNCWGLYAVDVDEDPDAPRDLIEFLLQNRINFLVSPHIFYDMPGFKPEWEALETPYQTLMRAKFESAENESKNLLRSS